MSLRSEAARLSRSWRRPRHDVVFYMPWIGSMLSRRERLPPGGAETQVLMLAKALVRHGLRVAIIAFGESEELPAEVDGVTIVARAPYKHNGPLAEILETWKSLWRTPSRTIIHRGAGIYVGIVGVYAWITRRRLVFATANVVDFDFQKLVPNRLYHFVYRLGTRIANAIVVQTDEQVALCEAAFGRRPTLIKSIATVAEPGDHAPEAFLWVGRLVSYKRPLEYVALARALPEARFWMVGVPIPHDHDSELVTAAVRSEAQELPNLELLTPRPHTEIQALMARAVASVNTADFEGMPNVLLEAWSTGVPALVLAHDPGGVVRRYGLGGYADDSPEKLAVLAREQWLTRSDRRECSERCRQYIEAQHAPDVVATHWLEVLSASAHTVVDISTADVEQTCAA